MPPLSTLAAGSILAALVLYTLTGGADFGGGVWNLLARGPRARLQRELVVRAIGPIWETNHIWLIVAVVVLFTAFPRAFAAVSTARPHSSQNLAFGRRAVPQFAHARGRDAPAALNPAIRSSCAMMSSAITVASWASLLMAWTRAVMSAARAKLYEMAIMMEMNTVLTSNSTRLEPPWCDTRDLIVAPGWSAETCDVHHHSRKRSPD